MQTELLGPNGNPILAKGASNGEALVRQAGGSYEEAVNRGNVYMVANQTGVATQAGLSATTPVLTLANPAGSGVKGILWYAGVTFLVVFAAAAAVWVAVGTVVTDAAVTGTLTTAHRNAKLGTGVGNKIKAFLAATLPSAPVGISLLGAGLTGAITTFPAIPTLERWFNGAIILLPNTNVSIQTSTVSGAAAALCEFIWEEVPV